MSKLYSFIKNAGVNRKDLFTLAALLLISLSLGLIIMLSASKPAYAVITVQGKELARLPLDENLTYSIGKSNIIEISDGNVRMIEADCPDKVCIHTGKISKSGQTIVCLPNRVVVSIQGGDDNTYISTR